MNQLSYWVGEVLRYTDVVILGYFLLLNSSLLVLVLLGGWELASNVRRRAFAGLDLTFRSPLTPSISVLMPAHNEGAGIVTAVHAMLALRYPRTQVVVIDDGSTDQTTALLIDEFDLTETPMVMPPDVPVAGEILGVYAPRTGASSPLLVRKTNGGRSDAVNAGINIADGELVCMVDADSVLDSDSLLTVVKPFIDDPLRVVATGGAIRVANGCTIVGGRVIDVRMPTGWLPRIQVAEYLRSFLLGRSGWSRLGSVVIISGAFGLFRRDLVVQIGGLARDTVGEDAELVFRLHRRLREWRADYRIVFVAEPVCWTEVPSTLAVLGRQRRRWHRGLTELLLLHHRSMIGNRRYGRIGLLALPFYLLFELLAPVVELAALVLIPAGMLAGVVDIDFAWRFLLVAYGYAMVVSLLALVMEELVFHRYRRWRDIAAIAAGAVLENVGYRQLTAWYRLQGSWSVLRGSKPVWGTMTRQGLGSASKSSG
ncbi:glycosyltransferase [Natronosporangium hydrolyticum]|uniref:Glycosyltransferase n=1 Tax=Natronosporangium hydrolyticum TaxID=2811111 RepID=A0A895YNU9_9ACTN|nr:glycosyltransferase family 2 protein [Natronosporangium hydrolyticum]QSB15800.1 glycosyltransferase [Natronosporangium hydrolyticum]